MSLVHHYNFDQQTYCFKSITTPSPTQMPLFYQVIGDVTDRIRTSRKPVIFGVLVLWICCLCAVIYGLVSMTVAVIGGSMFTMGIIILTRRKGLYGEKLVDQMTERIRKRKLHYDGILREISYTVNYSFHANGKNVEGYIEFIPADDLIQMNQRNETSRLDTFDDGNHMLDGPIKPI